FYNPDYSPLRTDGGFVPWGSNQSFVEPFTLPVTGTYTILLDPNTTTTGSVPITIYDVPPDITGSISIGGSMQTAANTVPGQNVNLSFSGTQGQEISLRVTDSNVDGSISILKPDGTTLAVAAGGFIDKQTLPASGTYTVFVNFGAQAVGSLNITLY